MMRWLFYWFFEQDVLRLICWYAPQGGRSLEEKLYFYDGLVDVGVQHLFAYFMDGVLGACDEVCGKKRGRKSKDYTWCWNEEVKEAISRKKDTHKAICRNSIEENKKYYNGIKNEAI